MKKRELVECCKRKPEKVIRLCKKTGFWKCPDCKVVFFVTAKRP